MKGRIPALLLFVAILAAAVVPCPPAGAVTRVGAVAGAGEGPPSLLPACPCSCAERPHAAGTPTAPGLALLRAPIALDRPPGLLPALLPEPRAASLFGDAPDPVPLVV